MTLQTATERPQVRMPLWIRIGFPCMFLPLALMHAWKDPHAFVDWIDPLSLACFFLFWRIREPGEPRRIYLTNLRALITNLSALAVAVTSVWWLIQLYR
jgi:hypothetical protein